MAKRATRRLALPTAKLTETGSGIVNSNVDDITDHEAESRALVVQATEAAIAASLAAVPHTSIDGGPVADGSPRQPGIAEELVVEADPVCSSVPVVEIASPGFHQDAAPTAPPVKAILAFNSTLESAMTTAEDFMAFGQANIEAFARSGQIWAAGVQDLGKQMAVSAQAQLDQTMSTWKAIAGVKSVKEALDMQTGLARAAVEAAVSETGKLTDASMKLSEQTFAPITARLSVAAEKFGRVAA